MLELTTDYALELGAVLVIGALLFSLAYTVSERIVVGFLVIMIPFQIIDSKYGSLNMVLTHLMGLALLARGQLRVFPLMPPITAIMLVYLLSASQALRPTWFDHGLYMLSIGSGFVLFFIVYNYMLRTGDLKFFFKLIVIMNVLVLAYCAIQLTVGFDRFAFLGVSEWAFAENRSRFGDYRLVGPFGAPGVNGEYFVLQILVLGYLVLAPGYWKRKAIPYAIMAANFGLLVATGSRGSFLTLLLSAPLFLFFFRRQLGAARVIQVGLVAAIGCVAMALVIVNYTQFNVLFDRLEQTVIEGGVPDSRTKSFEMAFERIPDAPILGHGPRLRLIDEFRRPIRGYETMPAYPHNLILFLLFTVGILGLLAYAWFFFALTRRFLRAQRYPGGEALLGLSPRLAIVLLIVFLVDQLKIEFLRVGLTDIQHYVFAFWGALLAISDRLYATGRSRVRARAATSRMAGVGAAGADPGETTPA